MITVLKISPMDESWGRDHGTRLVARYAVWFKVSRKGSPGPESRFILDNGVEVASKILNISRVGIHVHVPVRFDDGAVLTFRLHDCTAKGNVLYCRPDGEEFYMGLSTGIERRSEPRLSAYELVTVRVISADKSGRALIRTSKFPSKLGTYLAFVTDASCYLPG